MQEFINMICTRICHDVISSSQGILQGVESLDDSDKVFVEQSKLFIKDSAETLNAKLIFFRALCGRAGKLASVKELVEIGGKYLDSFNKRVYGIDYKVSGECENIELLKAGLAFCCIATDTLIRGGNLTLDYENNMLICKMKGQRLKLNEDIHNALQGSTEKLDPKNVVAAYLVVFLRDAGLHLSLNISEEEIIFMIK